MDYHKISKKFLDELNVVHTMYGTMIESIKPKQLANALESALKEYDRQKEEK